MTDALGHRPGAGNAEGFSRPEATDFYRNGGRALVVHGPGAACCKVARQIAGQCGELTIEVVLAPIAGVDLERLWCFSTLFLVLEPPFESEVDGFAEVLTRYRTKRPHPLGIVMSGAYDWQLTGSPVQALICGTDEDRDHPALHRLREACSTIAVNEQQPLGHAFSMYEEFLNTNRDEKRLIQANRNAALLRRWGVPSLCAVEPIRTMVEEVAKTFSDPKFRRAHSPIPRLKKEYHEIYARFESYNRLQLVMYAPDFEYPRSGWRLPPIDPRGKEKFDEIASNLIEKTIRALQQTYPSVRRPSHGRNKQDDFHEFFTALVEIDTLPAELRDRITE